MAAQASLAHALPVVKDTAASEIAHVAPAQVALESDELYRNDSPRIIGDSAALRRVLGMGRIVAPTDSTVLINGETGTGKELIAEAIHKWSGRSNGPFVKVNCAAIPSDLLENELFGHERGAYTGAIARSIGRFERANRGTLFLDEIGDLPLKLQPKLLRVLQDRRFERLGGSTTIHSDVRVICATHRNLTELTGERQFRADLFYRLSVFPIELPPLRERPEDIRLLAHHFAMNYADRMRKPITAISEEFMAALARHSWPGNVRELQNVIERSVILSTGAALDGSLSELPCRTQERSQPSGSSAPVTLKEAERSHILQTLRETGGVISGQKGAAVRLGLPRTTLISKMKRLEISPRQDSQPWRKHAGWDELHRCRRSLGG
jgi:formate hydrogenlyase transcriptional activator